MEPSISSATLNALLFYTFSFVLSLSAIFAVISKKSVHSVLWLISAFFAAAWVFLSVRAEFLAMLLIIIYVGAVAVLFLFVVMMLEEAPSEIRKIKYGRARIAFSTLVGGILFAELFVILMTSNIPSTNQFITFSVKDIGRLLYTEYFMDFQIMGLLFFSAMVGAIVLTLSRPVSHIKRQKVFNQISRNNTSVFLVKPEAGKGISIY